MPRLLTLTLLATLSGPVAAAQQVRAFAALAEGDVIADIATDASGFLYLAGSSPGGVFVAKLSPAAESLYRVVLPGTSGDGAGAVAADQAGAAYIAFVTSSRALATPGAHQRIFGAESYQTLLVKLDPAGEIVYATYIGGRSNTSPQGITVDDEGAAYVTGRSVGEGYPITPGAAVASEEVDTGYLAKIAPTGSELLLGLRGVGLGPIAVDREGAIYVAGSTSGSEPAPDTPGAFQQTHGWGLCGGSGLVGIGCRHGYVAKLSADGTQLLYATYVTGDHGSQVAALSVDGEGRALIAGTTNSRNFPTTSGALMPEYIAAKPRPPIGITPHPPHYPPPSAGFVAQLNADGTDLVFSTYFSGTVQETVAGMVRGEESLLLTGAVESPDLPGLDAPEACLPAGYVAEIALDGSAVLRTALLERGASSALTGADDLLVADREKLLAVDLDAAPARIGCVREAASLERANAAAPGSLLSLFGRFLVQDPLAGAPDLDGRLPTVLLGMSVLVGERAASLLYVSPGQINVQVPFEAEPGTEILLRDVYAAAVEEAFVPDQPRPLPIEERRPAVFLSAMQELYCPELQLQTFPDSRAVNPLAFDEAGRPIHCGNPARQGSEATIFLSGVGRNNPPLETGRISGRPPTPLSPPVALDQDGAITVLAAESLPGSLGGVWRVRFRVPGGDVGHTLRLEPTVDGIPADPGPLFVWVDWQ